MDIFLTLIRGWPRTAKGALGHIADISTNEESVDFDDKHVISYIYYR